jgi:hypothetical protein
MPNWWTKSLPRIAFALASVVRLLQEAQTANYFLCPALIDCQAHQVPGRVAHFPMPMALRDSVRAALTPCGLASYLPSIGH